MQRYDLFQIEPDGSPLWLGCAENLEEAKEQIRKRPTEPPCEFQIVDQLTGDRKIVQSNEN